MSDPSLEKGSGTQEREGKFLSLMRGVCFLAVKPKSPRSHLSKSGRNKGPSLPPPYSSALTVLAGVQRQENRNKRRTQRRNTALPASSGMIVLVEISKDQQIIQDMSVSTEPNIDACLKIINCSLPATAKKCQSRKDPTDSRKKMNLEKCELFPNCETLSEDVKKIKWRHVIFLDRRTQYPEDDSHE